MNPKLLLCLLWGVFCTYCLIIPYGVFIAWFGQTFWPNHWPEGWELIGGALAIPLHVMATEWYLALPLAAAIGWGLYLRRQIKATCLPKNKD
jgi:hypothetical protein